MKKNIFVLSLALGMSLFFVSCSNTQDKKETQTTSAQKVKTSDSEDVMPDITFVNEKGKSVSLKSLTGKVVFINFWATWCSPCKHELPSINTLKKSFDDNDNLVFLMVDVDGKLKQSTAFMDKNGYDLDVYAAKGSIPSNLLGNAIPTTIIFDKAGKMVFHEEGAKDYASADMIQLLKGLLGA